MSLAQDNKNRWGNCTINPNKLATFNSVAQRLTASKARYQAVSKLTGVPWWFIAVVHEREASQNWNSNIAQGDPWNRKSTHVPKGRGPFNSWEEAAVDALTNCAPYASKNTDWSIGGALAMLEKYNGLGYASKGKPSPYIWAGTNQYTKGKYVADGKYNPNVVDTQLGCAGILKQMNVFGVTGSPHIASTGAIAGAGAAAVHWYNYWPEILGVTVVAIGLVYLGYYLYERYKKHA